MQITLIILSLFFIIFLPGFTWSFVFFKKNEIDVIERVTLSFALSIALVPLIVFYINLLKIHITVVTVAIQVALVIGIAILLLVYREIKK